MSIADELVKLQQLKNSGAITHDEFEIAKDQVLQGTAPAPTAPAGIPDHNILKQVDPEVIKVADKAVNFQGASAILGLVGFLVVACIFAFVACSMTSRSSNDPLGSLCDQPNVTCTR